jgi:LysM repeat protein
MKNIIIILFVALSFSVYSQTEGLKTEVVNGKEYYLYPIEQGNTLYSISKKFNVTLQELTEANPDAEKGLSVGQVLRIPSKNQVTTTTEQTTEANKEEYIIHATQQGETLYSIAKLYGVKVSDLLNHNPEFENYLPLNSKVKVPKNLVSATPADENTPLEKLPEHPIASANDSLIIHKVEKGETVYAITKKYNVTEEQLAKFNDLSAGLKKGQKITIPLQRVKAIEVSKVEEVVAKQQEPVLQAITGAVNIAVFAPFMFDDYHREKAKCPTSDCEIYAPTERAINYYHGVEMAVDSLKKLGVSTNVHVYDSKRDSVYVARVLAKKEFETMHIIFAPFFENELSAVLHYAKTRPVMVVNVVPQSNEVLVNNKNVSKVLPSLEAQVAFMGHYLANDFANANVIAVRNNANKVDANLYDLFQKNYRSSLKNNSNRKQDSAYRASIVGGLDDIKSKLKKDEHNIIVVPSKDLRFVSDFMTKVNALDNNARTYGGYQISVFGLEDWLSFNNIDLAYFIKFNTMFATSSYVDYSNNEVKKFQLNYRQQYNYDPNRYSFAAFEAVLFHTYLYAISSKDFKSAYANKVYKGMHVNYDFEQVDTKSGFENKAVTIVGFENGQLIKKN